MTFYILFILCGEYYVRIFVIITNKSFFRLVGIPYLQFFFFVIIHNFSLFSIQNSVYYTDFRILGYDTDYTDFSKKVKISVQNAGQSKKKFFDETCIRINKIFWTQSTPYIIYKVCAQQNLSKEKRTEKNVWIYSYSQFIKWHKNRELTKRSRKKYYSTLLYLNAKMFVLIPCIRFCTVQFFHHFCKIFLIISLLT